VGEYYNDFDMTNCHNVILLYLVKKYYPNEQCKYLERYVNNRKEILDKHNITKKDVLIMLNSNKKYVSNNKYLLKLDNEFKRFQYLFYNELPEELNNYKVYQIEKKNKEGSFMNKILTIFESNILQETIKHFPPEYVSTLMFDGFHLDKDYYIKDVNEIIDKLNYITKEYNITWTIKPPDNSIKIDEGIIIEDFDNKDYKSIKNKFEKNHFMIENPLLFGKTYMLDGKLNYTLHPKDDFKTITKIYKYEEVNNNRIYTASIFDKWIEDEDKRQYKKINFIPNLKLNNDEYFNTFTGFDAEFIDFDNYKYNEECINIFKDHIGLLTNYNEKSINYVLNYIADMIQNTDKLPAIAMLFKSKQGFGKDLFLDILQTIIGHKYFFRTADLNEVFGSFNSTIKDKIILQLNEVDGKDGFAMKEKLKNLITEEYTNINEKKIKQYKQNNYLRIFIMSNNINPIEISHDDRRFVVFKAHFKKPNREYFNKLVNIKNNKNDIKTLYEYFKNFKININLREDRPKTDAYKEMHENNINPIYKFINEIIVKDNIDEYFDDYIKHKKLGILIKSIEFYDSYKLYLNENELSHYKITFKNIKSILADIGINKKQVKFNNKNNDYYTFNKEIIEQQLEHMDLEDDIIIIDDDDIIN
jgi:hypothetical protein